MSLAKWPVPLTPEQDAKIFRNQSAILEWLLSRGHEIEDKHLQPDSSSDGLDRWLNTHRW